MMKPTQYSGLMAGFFLVILLIIHAIQGTANPIGTLGFVICWGVLSIMHAIEWLGQSRPINLTGSGT